MNEQKIITTCHKHPRVATNLRCASCGKYICPKCVVQTPVGCKCRACSSHKGAAAFALSPFQAICATFAGLLAGAVAGWGVEFLGIFMIFLAIAYGGFAGEMIMRAAGRRRGVKLEVITGLSMTLGAIAARLIVAGLIIAVHNGVNPPYGIFNVIVDLVYPSPIPLIALIAAISSAVSRIRYI